MKRGWRFGGVISGFFLVCVGFIIVASHFNWTGTGFQNKTLWDWLQLLIVPLALAIIALLFNLMSTRADQKIATQRYEQDQYIALDKQREDLLQTYLDHISELLLEKRLRSSVPTDEVRNVARVRTISILFQLDARRVGYVFAFLLEASLMINHPGASPDASIVSLSQANLSKINLSQAILDGANFSGAKLIGANFSQASLVGADLKYTTLTKANLKYADLTGADLRWANLAGADLTCTTLTGADLTFADLKETTFKEAFLSGGQQYLLPSPVANLGNSDLAGADLTKANLRGVLLKGANLNKANFSGADLSYTNVTGANLTEANFSGADLTGVKYNDTDSSEEDFFNVISGTPSEPHFMVADFAALSKNPYIVEHFSATPASSQIPPPTPSLLKQAQEHEISSDQLEQKQTEPTKPSTNAEQ